MFAPMPPLQATALQLSKPCSKLTGWPYRAFCCCHHLNEVTEVTSKGFSAWYGGIWAQATAAAISTASNTAELTGRIGLSA